MPRININLQSTSLRSATYDPDTQDLDITFKTGMTYTYEKVPQDVFEGLRDAPSAGQYFHANIKGVYG